MEEENTHKFFSRKARSEGETHKGYTRKTNETAAAAEKRGKKYEAHFKREANKKQNEAPRESSLAERLGLHEPKGLERIILPELTRPFIANLSRAAGKKAKQILQSFKS